MKANRKKKIASSLASCLIASPALTGLAPVQAAVQDTQTPIKHTVVIFQENRSFDNYFGTYPYAPGFHPLPGTPTNVANFQDVAENVYHAVYNPDQYGNPVYPQLLTQLDTTDVDHNYNDMIAMVDDGKMDKFYYENQYVYSKHDGNIAMGYYDYNSIPALWQYAQHYAMADHWFQPVYGPSTPGALYLVAAQSGNNSSAAITGDPPPAFAPYGGDNPVYKGNYSVAPVLTYQNIGDELSSAGRTWAWYQGGWDDANAVPNGAYSSTGPANLYSAHHNPFQYFQNYQNGNYKNNLKDYNNLATDIQNGNLPEVSFVKAEYGEDEHPGGLPSQSNPSAEDFTVKTINQIMNSPYWNDTAIILAYDESGGNYDHVAPPNLQPGPDGLQGDGPRIPAIVISPYAKQNYVSHTTYDTASILKFIETNYGVSALNNHDANVNNITEMFDFQHPNFQPYIYQLGSSNDPTSNYYHYISGDIQLNGASPAGTTVVLSNSSGTVFSAVYGTRNSSQYGDYGVVASDTYTDKVNYYFEVPTGTYTILASNGNQWAATTMTANSQTTTTANGVTFFNDALQDLQLSSATQTGQSHPFTITKKSFTINGGVSATVNIAQTPGVKPATNKVVIFELMNGTTPVGINAVTTFGFDSQDVSTYFNATGTNYTLKVFVVDSYDSSSATTVGNNLADPLVISN